MRSRLTAVLIAAAAALLVGCSSSGQTAPRPTSEPPATTSSRPAADLTNSGRLQVRFEALLRRTFTKLPCSDAQAKIAIRFVPCRAPLARFLPYTYVFANPTDPLPTSDRAPRPGSI